VQIKGSWPPGVSVYHGTPAAASPFVQCLLPSPFKYEGKRSKAVSYKGIDLKARATNRTKEAAEQVAMAWSWGWWESLAQSDRATVQSCESSKKRRLT